MMKLRIKKIVSILVLICVIVSNLVVCIPASAAAAGTMMSNAVEVAWGKQRLKTWGSSYDHLNYYITFELDKQGVVTINATKPFDSEGEYGKMHFTLYNEDGEPIWGYDCYQTVDDAKSFYKMNVGLAPGRYYMTLLPGFRVTSGIIETWYTLTFKENAYCEVEPNGAGYEALGIELGKKYTGYYGSAGSDYEEYDYYKFPVEKGETYRVVWYNWGAMSNTSAMVKFIDPSGDDEYLSYYFSKKINNEGLGYQDIEVKQSGTGYLYIENFNGAPVEYGFVVTNVSCEKTGHDYETDIISRGSLDKAGKLTKTCSGCGDKVTETIKKISSVKLSDKSYTYNGKTKKPTVTVKDSSGKKISPKYYKVEYSGSRKKVGKYKVTVTFKGRYKGTKKLYFTIKPKKTSVSSVSAAKKSLKVKIKKQSSQTTGYEIQYATNSSFTKNDKIVKLTKNTKTSYTIKKLKAKKSYYVRVRTYKTVNGEKIYSSWSKSVKKKTK